VIAILGMIAILVVVGIMVEPVVQLLVLGCQLFLQITAALVDEVHLGVVVHNVGHRLQLFLIDQKRIRSIKRKKLFFNFLSVSRMIQLVIKVFGNAKFQFPSAELLSQPFSFFSMSSNGIEFGSVGCRQLLSVYSLFSFLQQPSDGPDRRYWRMCGCGE